jgi:hypothetical protein
MDCQKLNQISKIRAGIITFKFISLFNFRRLRSLLRKTFHRSCRAYGIQSVNRHKPINTEGTGWNTGKRISMIQNSKVQEMSLLSRYLNIRKRTSGMNRFAR